MADTNDLTSLGSDVGAIKARSAALKQAARLPGARSAELLTAALAELDSALVALAADADESAGMATTGQRSIAAQRALHSDRRLLQAVFAQVPHPLLVIDQEGTIQRANAAACELLGVGQGYATGRPLTSLVEPTARAAVRSQLASVARTGKPATLACRLAARRGVVDSELAVSVLTVRGDSDRLVVAIGKPGLATPNGSASSRASVGRRKQAEDRSGTELGPAARRFDLLSSAATLLLENAASSESVIVQRCARLLADGLASWVIVDLHRRDQLRRHFVAGPDEQRSAKLANVIVAIEPAPDSLPQQVCEAGSSVLISHPADDGVLGAGPDGIGLLTLLDAACVLSAPLVHGTRTYGVLTLARPSAKGQFSLAEAGLVEEICGLLSRAMSARRTLRRHTDAAAALSASLLPPVLRTVPGVEIASAHMPPTRGRAVGGDFYDVYPTKEGWGVAIGDVCGKGEDAAAATAAARHAIRVLGHWNDDPVQVLSGANEIMLAEQFGGRFVTAAVLHLSWRDRALRAVLATAGHPGPVLLRQEEGARLTPGGGLPLGIFPEPEAASQALDLQRGDVLFFFTDGLTGARSPNAGYLEESLPDILADKAQRHPAEIVSEMREHVIDFCGGVLLDDLSMLALRVVEPPGP